MCYSADLLNKFKEVSNFQIDHTTKKYLDDYPKEGGQAYEYPIMPIGQYMQDENPSTMEILKNYSISAFLSLGDSLFLYGLVRSSSPAITLGSLPFALTIKKICQVLTVSSICPATICGVSRRFPRLVDDSFRRRYLFQRQQARALITGSYDDESLYSVTNIKISRKGVEYDAYFVVWQNNYKHWVLHALDGNQFPGAPLNDYTLDYYTMMGFKRLFNHVIIAGPSVGHSSGWPNAENIGAGYSAAMELLENIGATHILMEARGLFGGATLAKAVESHDFKVHDIRYLTISIGCASSVGEAAKHGKLGRVAESIIKWTGMDIGSDKMNEKLFENDIKHLVIGHDDPLSPVDGFVHDKASLWSNLKKKNFSNVEIIFDSRKQSSYPDYFFRDFSKKNIVKEEINEFLEQ